MEAGSKNKRIKGAYRVLTVIAMLFAGLQFFNRPIAGKPVVGTIDAPGEVTTILERSCYGCHSNVQTLSWFEQLAPVSWIVKKDIERAREVMNFSEWTALSPADHEGRMYAILNMMQAGKMPLPEYTLLHPAAKVSEAEVDIIRKYTLSLSGKHPAKAPVSPDGVPYTNAFKDWKVISMSTLFDHSIRVIFGNDLAVKAVEEENFHPWPDGSVVVKAVWEQVEQPDGEIRTGKFVNAQFMEKDAEKYRDTEGWGFAKFNGDELIPTGKTALFAQQSCIACHRQLAASTGYLFDVPLKAKQSAARIVFDPKGLKFISSALNTKQGTMSALYGNDLASRTLSGTAGVPRPNSIMQLVTWRYHDNPQYTGGTINGECLSVESVYIDEQGKITYQSTGRAAQQFNETPAKKQARIDYIMQYRPALFPPSSFLNFTNK